jgi:pimeloyl-ACP methyl ester carboxylesterase
MPFVEGHGVRLHFEEAGSGHPIIFAHEFAADCREWETQLHFFSRAYRCIAYNARGYPPSDVPESPAQYGFELIVEDIAALMRGLSIDKAHIVGLSMGGYAALQFGLRHPQMASAIVAAGAGSGSPPQRREAWREQSLLNARGFLEKGMAAMAEEMGAGPTRVQLKRKDPRAFHEFMEHLKAHSPVGMSGTSAGYIALRPSLYDFKEAFGGIRVPVLLALGDEDEPCLETNLMLKQAIPTAGLWICPNTGHAINLEEPAAFNAEVQAFFSAVERGSWPSRAR